MDILALEKAGRKFKELESYDQGAGFIMLAALDCIKDLCEKENKELKDLTYDMVAESYLQGLKKQKQKLGV